MSRLPSHNAHSAVPTAPPRSPVWARRTACILAAALLLCACVLGMTGCKQSDFLKKIVFANWADITDTNHPVQVNNPDAEETSESFPAFDLEDSDTETDEVQNVVVYSHEPNTEGVTTRHSVFDLKPRYEDVEASDPVRLVFKDTEDALDHKTAAQALKKAHAKAKHSGKSKTKDQKQDTSSNAKSAEKSKASTKRGDASSAGRGKDAGGTKGGNSAGGKGGQGKDGTGGAGEKDAGGKGDDGSGKGATGRDNKGGDSDSDEDGRSARESGGYGGKDIIYDPGNAIVDPEPADHVAALGQAAIIAQAVGGKNAVVAMDEYTFDGLDADGADESYASTFKKVFSDELASNFEEDALLWKGDGTLPKNLKSTKHLVELCADKDSGEGGTIVFDERYGEAIDYFSSKQLEAFKKAGMQLVPIDTRTAQGIVDAFIAIGKVLKDSDETSEEHPYQNAKNYRSLYKDVLNAAASTHSGKFATESDGSLFSKYTDASFGHTNYDVWGAVADDFEAGANYKGTIKLDATDGLLFVSTQSTASYSPLAMYLQAGGVLDTSATNKSGLFEKSSTGTALVWPLSIKAKKASFTANTSGGALARMQGSLSLSGGHVWSIGDNVYSGSDSVGSELMPYLIVSGTGTATGEQMKRAMIKSSKADLGIYELLGADDGSGESKASGRLMGENLTKVVGDTYYSSTLGTQHNYPKSVFKDKGVDLSDCIRVNPCGLIGKWTLGTPESVLEALWIAELYSKYPDKSDYKDKVVSSGSFSVDIDGKACTSTSEAVKAFYSAVYRCSLGDVGLSYDDIVPDSGEGLK